jgi:hypothetical protein
MPHTKSRYQQDLGFNDARVFAGAGDVVFATTAGGPFVLTRVAAGDWSIHSPVATTGIIAVNITQSILRRLGFFEDLQEQYGGGGIAASAEYQGRPDTLGSMITGQEIQPRSALKVKGFKLNSFDVIYTVGVVNLTALTCRADIVQYIDEGAAPAPVNILPSAVNGLDLTQDATTTAINVAIPAPAYSNLADQALWIELAVQTAATGTFDFRGFDCLLEFNYN